MHNAVRAVSLESCPSSTAGAIQKSHLHSCGRSCSSGSRSGVWSGGYNPPTKASQTKHNTDEKKPKEQGFPQHDFLGVLRWLQWGQSEMEFNSNITHTDNGAYFHIITDVPLGLKGSTHRCSRWSGGGDRIRVERQSRNSWGPPLLYLFLDKAEIITSILRLYPLQCQRTVSS